MLTKEENELLTQTGPGTPCGELLRRYWQPVGYISELTAEHPIKRVKVLHEELIVYREVDGAYGCVSEHCAHRGASLGYGFVEPGGVRCPYHGWKYDAQGHCLEQPFEPKGSTYRERVQQPAYPVQDLAGMLFIYMGPQPAPLLPRWDILAWTDGIRLLGDKLTWSQEVLNCNWLQAEENTADVTHTYFLHGHTLYTKGQRGVHVDYYHRPFEKYGFQPFEWGLIKSWQYSSGGSPLGAERGGGNPLIFPNILRVVEHPYQAMHWRVPIDDQHTQIYWAGFYRPPAGQPIPDQPPMHPMYTAPQVREDGTYIMETFQSQDKMAWETQGPVYDRSTEHLGASDRGIVMFRKMLREQIEIVQRGGEPMALVRDPAKNQLIELPAWVAEGIDAELVAAQGGAVFSGATMSDIFDDEHHEVFEVPFGAARPE
jgi:5,5'-dehydrodivanillate O-demethylase